MPKKRKKRKMRKIYPRCHHLLLFIPEGKRCPIETPVDLHDPWTKRLMECCARLFDGATAYGRGLGIWQEKDMLMPEWDRITVIETWIDGKLSKRDLQSKLFALWPELEAMRVTLRQKEVRILIDGRWDKYTKKEKPGVSPYIYTTNTTALINKIKEGR